MNSILLNRIKKKKKCFKFMFVTNITAGAKETGEGGVEKEGIGGHD